MGFTSDDGARVQATVLLAPIGCNPGPLGQVAHRWGLHVDNLQHRREDTTSGDPFSQQAIVIR